MSALSSFKFAILRWTSPDCLVPKNSPGPLISRSFSFLTIFVSNVGAQAVKFSGCIKNPFKDKVEIWGPKRFYKVIDLKELSLDD